MSAWSFVASIVPPAPKKMFGRVTDFAIRALHTCVVSLVELVRIMQLSNPISMRFTGRDELLWASFFLRQRHRYVVKGQ